MTQRFSLPFVEHICLYFYITLNDVIKKNFQLETLRKLECGQVFKFLISCLSSWQSISKFIETAKLPTLIYSLDTILLAQIIQILCLHLLMSSSFPLKYFIAILNYKICFSQNFLPCVFHFQFLLLKIEFGTTSLYSGLLQKTVTQSYLCFLCQFQLLSFSLCCLLFPSRAEEDQKEVKFATVCTFNAF